MSCSKSRLLHIKGIVPQLCLTIKSHILGSNGVWYCSFWSEGSINPQNLKIFVPDFVPGDKIWDQNCHVLGVYIVVLLEYHTPLLSKIGDLINKIVVVVTVVVGDYVTTPTTSALTITDAKSKITHHSRQKVGASWVLTCIPGKVFSVESKTSGECRRWARRSRIGNPSQPGTSSGTQPPPWGEAFGSVGNHRHLVGTGSSRSRPCWGGWDRPLKRCSPWKSRTPCTESFVISQIVKF